jgi:NAD(P)-dependent dehydrogenase (short-subunit alcohol dehydrogenase family)
MTFGEFVKDQRKNLPIVPTTEDCKGRTYIVTGANAGLGYECAKHLVKLSAKRVILGVRSISKGKKAQAKLEAETGRDGVVEVWQLDLGSYSSVKEFAAKVQELDRVDAVIENAGIALDTKSLSEGLETTLTVNIVSTFLLAVLVLPKLQESGRKFGTSPHLVVVGSGTALDVQEGELEKIDGDILDELSEGPMEASRYIFLEYCRNETNTLTE